MTRSPSPLQRLLDQADALSLVIRARIEDPGTAELADQRREESERLRTELRLEVGRLQHQTPFGTLVDRYSLEVDHLLVLLSLLRQRLLAEEPSLSGRDVLKTLYESTYDLLAGVRLLGPSSPLISAGVVTPQMSSPAEGVEMLDLRYRISDRAFRLLLRSLDDRSDRATVEERVRPYQAYLHYLMDLRRLALLYQKRAARVFHFDDWDELGLGIPDSVAWLNQRIPRYSALLRQNLEVTPKASEFPIVKIASQCGLDEDECVILVTMVFQELTRGDPYLDATDLLKLVCRSEEDLVRKRKIFDGKSPLVSHQLVVLEEMLLGKDLSAEVYVPNQVVDRVLGPIGRTPGGKLAIDEESRVTFQKFLRELEDSDDFFDRL